MKRLLESDFQAEGLNYGLSDVERDRVTQALLKYCELDTFAMVLIYEYWAGLVFGAKWTKSTKRAA